MIGLYKSVRDFRADKLSSFRAFAELCITRQIITAIKTATRQKHQPLNSYVSLNKPVYDEESERTLLDIISGTKITNPEDIIIDRLLLLSDYLNNYFPNNPEIKKIFEDDLSTISINSIINDITKLNTDFI